MKIKLVYFKYLFQNENHHHHCTSKLSNKVQEKYLSLCQLFIEKSIPSLCKNVIENVVKNVVGEVSLSQQISLVDIEKYLNTMLSLSDHICIEGNFFMINLLNQFFQPETENNILMFNYLKIDLKIEAFIPTRL